MSEQTTSRLQAGGHIRIYRDGTELQSIVQAGGDGALVVRSLPAGVYVARDEVGGSREFAVTVADDETVVQAGEDISVQPGASKTLVEERPSEDGPIYPPQPAPREFPADVRVGDDGAHVLGEPGTSLIGEALPAESDREPDEEAPDGAVEPDDASQRASSGNVGHVPLAEPVKTGAHLPVDVQPEESQTVVSQEGATDGKHVTDLTVAELRAELERHGKPAAGRLNKAQLVERVRRARRG